MLYDLYFGSTVILLAAICNHLRAIDFGRASLTQARPGPKRFELNQNEAFLLSAMRTCRLCIGFAEEFAACFATHLFAFSYLQHQ